jgi:phospholipid/cholesterol/gamma-HCH transport system ATP-binding protein
MTGEPISNTDSAPSEQLMLSIQGLGISFGAHEVLRNINLQVPRGQTLAIIGESGCGKTVLLKALIQLIEPTTGNVFFDGQDLSTLNMHELAKQRIRFGFIFQQAALFDSMTIGQNVAFPLLQHTDLSEAEVQQRVLDQLADVGLPDSVIDKKPAELSGGMRKRVGVARALMLNPELVLYDEPTTGLDPIVSDVINELILRSRRRYCVTSIVVTHDMRTARKVADRVVMLYPTSRLSVDEPQVIFDGPPSELDRTEDRRVVQFVRGEAGARLMEMRAEKSAADY